MISTVITYNIDYTIVCSSVMGMISYFAIDCPVITMCFDYDVYFDYAVYFMYSR